MTTVRDLNFHEKVSTFLRRMQPREATVVETGIQKEPVILRRLCGGWLAVSAHDDSLRIGVVAPTETEARDRFWAALEAWRIMLASGDAESRGM
jgi:hypothetical protein